MVVGEADVGRWRGENDDGAVEEEEEGGEGAFLERRLIKGKRKVRK